MLCKPYLHDVLLASQGITATIDVECDDGQMRDEVTVNGILKHQKVSERQNTVPAVYHFKVFRKDISKIVAFQHQQQLLKYNRTSNFYWGMRNTYFNFYKSHTMQCQLFH